MSGRLPPTETQIPDPDIVVPIRVAFTVTETAIWLGYMDANTTGRARANAEERVRALIRKGHLRARGDGIKLISGGAIREYLAGDDHADRVPA
jgi:hypothetical protein